MFGHIVVSLIYLTLTQPNIVCVVGVISGYMIHPKKPHLDAVKHILRNVKGAMKKNAR